MKKASTALAATLSVLFASALILPRLRNSEPERIPLDRSRISQLPPQPLTEVIWCPNSSTRYADFVRENDLVTLTLYNRLTYKGQAVQVSGSAVAEDKAKKHSKNFAVNPDYFLFFSASFFSSHWIV